MTASLDYREHIRRESARFTTCLTTADPAARVPTCPDWNANDLLWHLTEVQFFWAAIVRDRLADPDAADAAAPARPGDRTALLALSARATERLLDALATTPIETEVWTWAADQHVGFVLRWQAHEALMHRIDAELVAGDRTAIEPGLASDGIDAALTIVHSDLPSWAVFTPAVGTGVVESRDTHAAWSVALGRFTGTSPNTGNVYDRDGLHVVERSDAAPAFTVRGDAADLDAWLWGRGPAEPLEVDGDRDAFARFEQVVDRGIP